MQDAFTAGVEPGGLNNTQEIRILLCYMLHTLAQPIKRDDLLDILLGRGMTNYFDTQDAIEELLRKGHLVQDEEQYLTVSSTGSQIGDSLSMRVPYTLRERAVESALQLLKRRRIEKENTVDIRPLDHGGYEVTCTVLDQERKLMSTTLWVADKWQADTIKEQFLTDPTTLYRGTLAVLTGDTTVSPIGDQLIIDLG